MYRLVFSCRWGLPITRPLELWNTPVCCRWWCKRLLLLFGGRSWCHGVGITPFLRIRRKQLCTQDAMQTVKQLPLDIIKCHLQACELLCCILCVGMIVESAVQYLVVGCINSLYVLAPFIMASSSPMHVSTGNNTPGCTETTHSTNQMNHWSCFPPM